MEAWTSFLDLTNCKFVIKCSTVANKIATTVLPLAMKKKVRGSIPSEAKSMSIKLGLYSFLFLALEKSKAHC